MEQNKIKSPGAVAQNLPGLILCIGASRKLPGFYHLKKYNASQKGLGFQQPASLLKTES
jgi:hypothetical protein